MTSPWQDLDRPPLRAPALRAALLVDGALWTDLRVVDQTGSTNADVAALARSGGREGLVLVAEEQVAGRGRADRSWRAPARSGIAVSVLLRPPVPRETWGWLPLLAGLSVVGPVAPMSGLNLGLKWPNDVLVDGTRKLAGVLAEVVDDAVVLGIGLNVSLQSDERPSETATSLQLEASQVVDRDPVLRAILRDLDKSYRSFVAAGGDAARSGLLDSYRAASTTVGRAVLVTLPGGRTVEGAATDIDAAGRLVVRTSTGVQTLAAGDVTHVR